MCTCMLLIILFVTVYAYNADEMECKINNSCRVRYSMADHEDARVKNQILPALRKPRVLITQSLSALFCRGNEYKTPVTHLTKPCRETVADGI